MREIKFRAWDGKKMTNNFYFTAKGNLSIIDSYEIYQSKDWPAMQFTGLYDKNKKPIYEGDIIASPFTGVNFPVVYEVKYAQFTYGGAEFNVEENNDKVEVLGNIYQNPELLQQ